MRIYLLGFMGSGKSFTGRRLAERLSYSFVDLDDQIEAAGGQAISTIFQEYGEAHFRELERSMLHQTATLSNAVIACGGGTPCYYDNMDWMNRHGYTIYLDTPVETLVQRLLPEKDHRPLLRALSPDELGKFIEDKLSHRSPFYRQARLIYSQQDPVADVAAELYERITDYTDFTDDTDFLFD